MWLTVCEIEVIEQNSCLAKISANDFRLSQLTGRWVDANAVTLAHTGALHHIGCAADLTYRVQIQTDSVQQICTPRSKVRVIECVINYVFEKVDSIARH